MDHPRSRKWFGTIWDQTDLDSVMKLKYSYLIVSALDQTAEIHEGRAHDHWHVFIQFKSNRKHPATHRAHWEIPKSITGAIEYCRNKGVPTFEEGVPHLNTADKGDWNDFLKAA